MKLEAMALSMPEFEGHPNRRDFRGILTFVGTASDRPPAGARGNRVLLTRTAVERALPSLLGMAVDYTPRLDGHDTKRKIGVITEANVVSRDGRDLLEVAGHIFAHDFPELVREIEASHEQLGMSYEIADARGNDVAAGLWAVTEFKFTGAAVLLRNKAAYCGTSFFIGSKSRAA